jgi:peptidoglycan/LPS O-acetylase OafA/YrhL
VASLNEKLAESAGRPTGFDYLRISLALAVVVVHSVVTSYGSAADKVLWVSPARGVIRLILPMFFALSGYLVSGSFFRTRTVAQFLALRVIRIYPALAVEVLLSALIVGPLLTTVPLETYFHDAKFAWYLFNVTGHIHYELPGVFQSNPYPDKVNEQLWTVPFELICYLTFVALAVLRFRTRSWVAPVLFLAGVVGFLVLRAVKYDGRLPLNPSSLGGPELVLSFLAGVAIHSLGDRLPWRMSLCVMSGALSVFLLQYDPIGEYVCLPFVAYFTVSLGLVNFRRSFLLLGADYSYGVYLYGYVIQQALACVFPWSRVWWINILLSVPLAIGIAAVSWGLVERPALGLRRYVLGPRRS